MKSTIIIIIITILGFKRKQSRLFIGQLCSLTPAAVGTDDVWVSVVELVLTAELTLHVERRLAAALGIHGPLLNGSLAADLLDHVVRLVDAVDGVDGTTVDVIPPLVQSSLAADLFHVIVRPTITTVRIGNCKK